MTIDRTHQKRHSLKNAVILITGGTGTFGRAFLDKCLCEDAAGVRIFSRDEKKQYDMSQEYKGCNRVQFFLGDVRDKSTVDVAMCDVDYVFHAAAMKQVPSCEQFPMEAVKTNVIGSANVLSSAIEHCVRKVVCLSTDKAVYPTSAMGMTKAYMEKLALQKSLESKTEICMTRFGNLVASRGSAVPVFIEQLERKAPITITDPDMTRFMMTVAEAAELVKEAFEIGRNGDLLVRKTKACTTGDLAKAVCRYMNVPDDYPIEYIGMRAGEKMHESLLTEEEASHASMSGNFIIVNPSVKQLLYELPAYQSDKAERMTQEEVYRLICSVFEGGAR